jgi:hypothetical protein
MVNNTNEMGKDTYLFGVEVKAAGSTSIGAFSRMPVSEGGFGKA